MISGHFWKRIRSIFGARRPLLILPYRSFANRDRIFLKGRVLQDRLINQQLSNSKWRSLMNSIKRFRSREIPHQPVRMVIEDQHFTATTTNEGYFIIDQPWKMPNLTKQQHWLPARLFIETPAEDAAPVTAQAEVLLPCTNAAYGVISDIDDTILQTHVNSILRLKLLYATFFKNAHQRLPVEGVVKLFQQLAQGKSGRDNNPFFYVSNSPWNLYDLLERFLDFQQLPKGPILLRDYGYKPDGPFKTHKLITLTRIFEMYPHLAFVLFGDTASEDADHYLALADRFPQQVKAVYIRLTQNTRNARRVLALIQNRQKENIRIVRSSAEMKAHAQSLGLI